MELPVLTVPKFSGSPITFLKEVKQELKKVKWPSRPQVIKMTIVVLAISTGVSLLISGLDFFFTKLMEQVVK